VSKVTTMYYMFTNVPLDRSLSWCVIHTCVVRLRRFSLRVPGGDLEFRPDR